MEDLEHEEGPLHDVEGTQLQFHFGRGVFELRDAYGAKLETLVDSLGEVKVLYRTKFGEFLLDLGLGKDAE